MEKNNTETSSTQVLQKDLRRLIADDQPKKAIKLLLERTEAWQLDELHKKVVLLSSRLKSYQSAKNLGARDADDLSRMLVNINQAILNLADELPAQPPAAKRMGKLWSKLKGRASLKTRALYLLLAAKFLIILFLFTQWEAGGFSSDQFTAVVALLFPLFATYAVLFFRDDLHWHSAPGNKGRSRRTYAIFFIYLLVYFIVVSFKAQGQLAYKWMLALLALAEGALGAYLGQLLFDLRKEDGGR